MYITLTLVTESIFIVRLINLVFCHKVALGVGTAPNPSVRKTYTQLEL